MVATGAAVAMLAILAQSGWSASAGTESFALRDISRAGPPADASPVKWEGRGPSVSAVFERAHTRLHRVTFDVAHASGFRYVGPAASTRAVGRDSASRVEGRYEYRLYPFRDLAVRGLDAGVGVQGLGRWLALSRHVTEGAQQNDSMYSAVACAAVARFHRWRRWSAELSWTNGLGVLHARDRHSVDERSSASHWGGGWLTDLQAAASVRVGARTHLTVSFLDTGEGAAISHHNFAFERRRLVAGVTYDR